MQVSELISKVHNVFDENSSSEELIQAGENIDKMVNNLSGCKVDFASGDQVSWAARNMSAISEFCYSKATANAARLRGRTDVALLLENRADVQYEGLHQDWKW